MQKKGLIIIVITTTILLLIPLIAMQFTNEVNWTVYDFIIAGFFLLTAGIFCEVAIRTIRNIKFRIAVCALIFLVFILIWVEFAVGIIAT
jgi:hypothetical protein